MKANPELYHKLSAPGLNVSRNRSQHQRCDFKLRPKDYTQFAADFCSEAFRRVTPVEISVNELLLTTETKPYMREGTVVRRFPLAPNWRLQPILPSCRKKK